MSIDELLAQSPPTPAALREIDLLLDDVARLAQADVPAAEFYAEFAMRLARGLDASAAGVWIAGVSEGWRLAARVETDRPGAFASFEGDSAHAAAIDAVGRSRRGRLWMPASGTDGREPAENASGLVSVLCPICTDDERPAEGVVEVLERAGGSPATQQGCLRLVEALCELAAEYHRRQRALLLELRAAEIARFENFVDRVHGSLDLPATAYTIANEARRFLECDRFSVALCRGRSWRLAAVSGQDTIERRANQVQRLEELVASVAAAGEPVWFSDRPDARPPQVEQALSAFLDESQARAACIVPVRAEAEPGGESAGALVGAFVAEQFTADRFDDRFRARIGPVVRHSGLALRHAVEHRSLPLFGLAQRVRRLAGPTRLPRALFWLAAIAAVVAALVFVPSDFTVEARGALQPAVRRDVFAGSDGIVSEVQVEHGQMCRAGDVLAVLTRSQLDFEFSRVEGEMQTARKRLEGLRAARLDSSPQTALEREKFYQLAGEEEELKEQLAGLERQYEILRLEREGLTARSPIDGQVITWNVQELLVSRPVARGQVLMTVADLAGPWVLEVEVPDDRIGHILEARRSQPGDLPVSFLLATAPGTTCRGTVETVAVSAEPRGSGGSHVMLTVGIDREQVPHLRPGATVVTRIHCGTKPLGYVWFHGLLEAIQKHVWF